MDNSRIPWQNNPTQASCWLAWAPTIIQICEKVVGVRIRLVMLLTIGSKA